MGKTVKFPGISEQVQGLLDANMDQVAARRRAREAFKDIQLSIDYCLFKGPRDGLKMEECVVQSYEVNSRGLEIFSKSWLPENGLPKAVVCFCHGYGDTCTFFFEGIYFVIRMVVVLIAENPEFHSLPSFLFGESMGGAIALKVHLKQPNAWSGAILVAPMCKIADDMVPAWVVTQVLIGVAKVLPKQKLVPQKDFRELAFRDSRKKDLATYNVVAYKDKPRLRTALELLRTTQEFEHQLVKVSLPLLILHGSSDMVTDPSISKALYEKASSSDKKLNLYEDSYHCLLEGEPDDTILRVFGDIVSWLDKHS
ncbi:hypothetical protein LguiA_005882 [Lonicera macranthoides]